MPDIFSNITHLFTNPDIGSFSSILGLAISIWVLINTYKLKNSFKVYVRLPGLVDKLAEHTSNLKKHYRKFESSVYLIKAELSRIEANLETLKEKERKAQKAIQQVLDAIKAYKDNPTDKEKYWEIHTSLQGLIEKVKNLQEDRRGVS